MRVIFKISQGTKHCMRCFVNLDVSCTVVWSLDPVRLTYYTYHIMMRRKVGIILSAIHVLD